MLVHLRISVSTRLKLFSSGIPSRAASDSTPGLLSVRGEYYCVVGSLLKILDSAGFEFPILEGEPALPLIKRAGVAEFERSCLQRAAFM